MFPCISTGAFGFPRERAAGIALATVSREAPRYATLERVVFCCYSESDAAIYRGILRTIGGRGGMGVAVGEPR